MMKLLTVKLNKMAHELPPDKYVRHFNTKIV